MVSSDDPQQPVSNPPPVGGGAHVGWYGRGQQAWKGYAGLRHHARQGSLHWWFLKIVQGFILGGGLLVLPGFVLLVLLSLFGWSTFWTLVAVLLISGGLLIIGRYVAAPLTCKWEVRVPENCYYVVEDGDHFTKGYLASGKRVISWHWNWHVRDYANFTAVLVNAELDDVPGPDDLPVDMIVSVLMGFDPTTTPPSAWPALRQMNTQEIFQAVLKRDISDIVRKQLYTMTPEQGKRILRDVSKLETVIADGLKGYASMGLKPITDRAVTVHIHSPQNVRQAYQDLWAHDAKLRTNTQTLLDIQTLAGQLGKTYDETFRMVYMMNHGTFPAQIQYPQMPNTPPLYVINTTSTVPPDWNAPRPANPDPYPRQNYRQYDGFDPGSNPRRDFRGYGASDQQGRDYGPYGTPDPGPSPRRDFRPNNAGSPPPNPQPRYRPHGAADDTDEHPRVNNTRDTAEHDAVKPDTKPDEPWTPPTIIDAGDTLARHRGRRNKGGRSTNGQ